MPAGFNPAKNAAHRLACISLYRALLRECAKLPFPTKPKTQSSAQSPISTLRALIKYRFQQNRKIRGWQHIRNALQLGHQTLHRLEQASAGSASALNILTNTVTASIALAERKRKLLEQFESERAQGKLPKTLVEVKKRVKYLADKSNHRRDLSRVPVLERPVPYDQALKHADGRRKVPSYFVVSRVSFLRYTSHQPLSLTRYIQSELKKQQKLSIRAGETEEKITMAEMEDQWDRRISTEHRISLQHSPSLGADNAKPWSYVHQDELTDIQKRMATRDSRKFEYSQKLWEVFLKEEALAKQENTKRKEEGRRRWLEKQKIDERNGQEETARVSALFENQNSSQPG